MDENNIFEKLNVADFKTIRKRMISEILATDMANHGKVMSVIKARISDEILSGNKNNIKFELLSKNPKTQFEEQQSLLDFFIHAADLAHNTKLFKISLQWVELLSNEFWLQGDKEKEMKLPVSFLCDRVGCNVPNSQVGFIKGFILPTFQVLVTMFPSLNYTVENAKNNINEWQKLVDEKRITGWTPRGEKNEDKSNESNFDNDDEENGISKNENNNTTNNSINTNLKNSSNNNSLGNNEVKRHIHHNSDNGGNGLINGNNNQGNNKNNNKHLNNSNPKKKNSKIRKRKKSSLQYSISNNTNNNNNTNNINININNNHLLHYNTNSNNINYNNNNNFIQNNVSPFRLNDIKKSFTSNLANAKLINMKKK